jgi:hypothetical protein
MRLSLLYAAAGWVVFAVARLSWPAVPAVDVAVVIPLALTLVWLSHIVAYARRRAAAPGRIAPDASGDEPKDHPARHSSSSWMRAIAVAVRASLGGPLPDADEAEVLAAYENALGIAERLKRERQTR